MLQNNREKHQEDANTHKVSQQTVKSAAQMHKLVALYLYNKHKKRISSCQHWRVVTEMGAKPGGKKTFKLESHQSLSLLPLYPHPPYLTGPFCLHIHTAAYISSPAGVLRQGKRNRLKPNL